ncbi:MAG: hypothetical protein CL908_09595 [Deltaproteobacteria bacterium]|jgi:hypothetical protein|nr:hypothetical protein [Deltaproteobacteria bacterium]
MFKYYLLLFVVFGMALFYVYTKDPCNQQARKDFLGEHPDFVILDSGASEGSPETVRCHVSYREPGNEQVYQDTLVYRDMGRGWQFHKVLEARRELQPR